jgi:hypothetical protein
MFKICILAFLKKNLAMTEWRDFWQGLHEHDLSWISEDIKEHSTGPCHHSTFPCPWQKVVYQTKNIQGRKFGTP